MITWPNVVSKPDMAISSRSIFSNSLMLIIGFHLESRSLSCSDEHLARRYVGAITVERAVPNNAIMTESLRLNAVILSPSAMIIRATKIKLTHDIPINLSTYLYLLTPIFDFFCFISLSFEVKSIFFEQESCLLREFFFLGRYFFPTN